MKKLIAIVALMVTALAAPVAASESGDVGCVTVEVNADNAYPTLVSLDEGVRWAYVGSFLWVQFTDVPDSLNNVVSYDLTPYADGDVVTACTDYIAPGETISTGEGAALEQTTDSGKVVVYSTDAPHPEYVEEWIKVENGYLIK